MSGSDERKCYWISSVFESSKCFMNKIGDVHESQRSK